MVASLFDHVKLGSIKILVYIFCPGLVHNFENVNTVLSLKMSNCKKVLIILILSLFNRSSLFLNYSWL